MFTCCRISQAAASGSVKTAASSATDAGTRCRFIDGKRQEFGEGAVEADDAENVAARAVRGDSAAAKAHGLRKPRPAQDTLISPTTRRPSQARCFGLATRTTSPTNSWPSMP